MIKESIINCKKLTDFFEKFGLVYLKRNLPILSGKTPLQAGHCEKIGQVFKHISKSHLNLMLAKTNWKTLIKESITY